MKKIKIYRTASTGWVGIAPVVLLFALTAIILGDETEKDRERRAAPTKSESAKPAAAAPATRQAPDSQRRPSSDTVNRPTTERGNRPATDSVTRPTSERGNRPAVDTVNRPTTERGNRPATDSVTRPTSERGNRPAVDTVNRPTTERGNRPATDSVTRPTTERGNRPATDSVTRPTTERGNRPATDSVTRPTTERGNRPAADSVTRPTTERGNRPATDSVTRPTTERGNRPVTDSGSRPTNTPGNRRLNVPSSGKSQGQVTRRPDGKVESYRGPNNTEARFRQDGRVAVVRKPGMTITTSSTGVRRTMVERPDRTVIVTHGPGHGYVQRPFVVRNQSFVQRTYYVNSVPQVRVYRPYAYRGVTLNVYTPVRYYSPAFYGWAYSPWRSPVRYEWGWGSSPWYGYYGGYFRPYSVYSSPVFWLTDFFMAATLEEAYRERAAAAAEARNNVLLNNSAYNDDRAVLTPEVKQAIADEVQRQLAMERAESEGAAQNSMQNQNYDGLPPGLSGDTPHVFVVARSLDVPDLTAGGQECSLTEGDVLQMNGTGRQESDSTTVVVLASRGRDCRKGSQVVVSLRDLSEMQNQMRVTIEQGLQTLQSRQGQNGIPALPASARSAPVEASFASAVPPPDQNIAYELRQQGLAANQAEQEVVSQAMAPDAGVDSSAGTAIVTMGQTTDQVVSILGPPKQIFDLGAKKLYMYKDMKIIFMDGRVSDVQ